MVNIHIGLLNTYSYFRNYDVEENGVVMLVYSENIYCMFCNKKALTSSYIPIRYKVFT